ncbi:hypothetical protein RC62_1591 [Flavobacterium aquidurense]|uniref:Uncharacterized protein n=1 Tax=Flavobacterium aquidurense TaxID=362413 RepID=A0A0Q1BCS8_9FLAO|nr:hypothetical protein RC62_1591 [Flavobacterium aquidurense]
MDIGASPVTINPAAVKTVFNAKAGAALGLPKNLYTAGAPFVAVSVVTKVPSLLATVIFTVDVEFVAITISLALLKYCQGAGAM